MRFKFISTTLLLVFCISTSRLSAQSADSLAQYWYEEGAKYSQAQQFDSSHICLDSSSCYAKIAQNWELLVTAQLDQGLNYIYQQKWDSAAFYNNQSLKSAKENLEEEHPILINIHHLQGIVYYYYGNYNKALGHAKKALKLRELLQVDSIEIAENMNNIAAMYMEMSAYGKALEYYEQALHLSNKSVDLLPSLYINMGLCKNYLYENEAAIAYYKKAESALSETSLPNIKKKIHLFNSISIAYRDMAKTDIALEYLEKAMNLHKNEVHKKGGTLVNLGFLYLQKGEKILAKKYLTEALDLYTNKKHPDRAKIYLYLGNCCSKGKEALVFYQKGIALLVKSMDNTGNPVLTDYISSPRNLLKLLVAKAEALEKGVEKDLSLRTYHLAADLILQMQESYPLMSTKFFLAKITTTIHEKGFDLAYQLYLKKEKMAYLEEALFFAERTKSKLLFEQVLQQQRQKINKDNDDINKEQSLYQDIEFYKKKWFEAKSREDKDGQKKYQQFIFEMDEALALLQKKNEKTTSIETKESMSAVLSTIKPQLKEKDILLEYYISNGNIYLFVIRKENQNLIQLNTLEKTEEIINQFWAGLLNPSTKLFNETRAYKLYTENAFLLYKELLGNLLSPKHERLFIVQDERMSFIPFEALIRKKASSSIPNYLELDYLSNSCELSYNYSLRMLKNSFEQTNKVCTFSYLGLAPFSETNNALDLLELPNSKKEIEAAESYLGGNIFHAEAANFERLDAYQSSSIIHFATHAVVNSKLPNYSFIALGSDSLEYFEIKRMSLNTNLVVLSACETGVGELIEGEGSLSLARAFRSAGTPSLLMTLWKTRDVSSYLLMTYFYKNLSSGLSKSKSLQLAKNEYLENDADGMSAQPYFWAPYVLIGNTMAIPLAENGADKYLWLLGILAVWGLFFILKRRQEDKNLDLL